jgi:hypothetical protein
MFAAIMTSVLVALPAVIWSFETVVSGYPSACDVTKYSPGAIFGIE